MCVPVGATQVERKGYPREIGTHLVRVLAKSLIEEPMTTAELVQVYRYLKRRVQWSLILVVGLQKLRLSH